MLNSSSPIPSQSNFFVMEEQQNRQKKESEQISKNKQQENFIPLDSGYIVQIFAD